MVKGQTQVAPNLPPSTYMVMDFPRGAECRKWDLHVHTPGTQLSYGYEKKDGKLDWERFCSVIHDSDVLTMGITDCFSRTKSGRRVGVSNYCRTSGNGEESYGALVE
jgi:hypothetical protein